MPELADYLAVDRRTDDEAPASIHDGAVTAIAQCTKVFVQFGTIVLLARLIVPEAFGIVAAVVAVVALFELFRDLGFSTLAVRQSEVTPAQWSNLFWATAGASVVGFLAICALAPVVAQLFSFHDAGRLTLWLGGSVLLTGLSTQHAAMLRRQKRMAALAVIEIGATLFGASVAIVAALTDAGIWALVAHRFASAAAMAVVAHMLCRWRPALPRRGASIRKLIGYGDHRTVPAIVGTCARNLDYLLIGWWWGAIGLALFERTSRLFVAPVQNIDTPVFAIAMPSLRRLKRDADDFRHAYTRMLQAICMATMPAAAALAAAPDWAVSVLLGYRWLDAAPIAMWLGVAVISLPAINTTRWLFVGEDRTGDMARWSVADFALRMTAVVCGLPFGVVGVAAAFALSAIFVRLPLLFWAAGRRGPVSATDLYGALLPAAAVAAVVFGAIFAGRRMPEVAGGDALTGLSVALALALVATVAGFVCLPRGRRTLRELRALRALLFRQEARP